MKIKARLDLHEALLRKSYDHAVICTYTFDPTFFEDYCLEKFNCLNNNGNITVIVDRGTYDKAIIGPELYRPKQANLRYLLHPITVHGAFHPKIFLLASRNKGKLVLGSANFTYPGITSNAELVGCYEYEFEKEESFKFLFQAVYAFLIELSTRYPSQALTSNLQAISRDATWLLAEDDGIKNDEIEFVHNLDVSLWDQIISKTKAPTESIYILSRYFDSTPTVLNTLTRSLDPKTIKIFTQNGITTLTQDWLKHPLVDNDAVEIYLCEYRDSEYTMPLHAKAIAIVDNDNCVFGFGSANFTSPAMFSTAKEGNIEVFLILRGPIDDFEPQKLFDPDDTAFRLKNEELLNSSCTETDDFVYTHYEITLFEAVLIEDKICLRANIPTEIASYVLSAKLTFRDNTQESLSVYFSHDENYYVPVSAGIIQLLSESSTVIQIAVSREDKQLLACSNPLLITNLLDIHSGKNIRRERHIREAQQSAAQFYAVLKDLIEWGDESDLLVFLNYCDIPVMDALRPIFARGMRPVWDGAKGMRNLGERNLSIFNNLHEAVIFFIDRHLKKLQHHIDYGGINGIANFMHIFFAIGGVLSTQVERAILGFESKTQPISGREWFTYRERFNTYFLEFKQLLQCLSKEYLPRMMHDYDSDEVKKRFDPDVIQLKDLCSTMLHYRDQIELLRTSHLKIKTEIGQIVNPRYFQWCILSEDQWARFLGEIEPLLQSIEKLDAGIVI